VQLTANANVAIALVLIPILRYSGILGTADEAVLNFVHKNEYADQSVYIPKINSVVSLCLAQIKKSIIDVFRRLRLFSDQCCVSGPDTHGSALICFLGSGSVFVPKPFKKASAPT
jgi:hypothetical protein